ncbi:hypothetical protein RJ639_004930 [Escallonia herrerae]|uniref:Peroxidase n=1 Tax=Escallonia herrerae TaxID=1293975 RepID=A0AA89AXV2_9ASTE|nr:hypothetical protein RJ639_004930 [Escallonia herrerae]
MALNLALCFLIMLIKLSVGAFPAAKVPPPNTLNDEACADIGVRITLRFSVYQDSCPEAESIIFSWVDRAVSEDPRMAASLLRLHFHDCFVNASGPSWEVQMGRRDSISASKTAANSNIPGPRSDVATLVAKFQNVGLNLNDMITLSGAHTIGKARCSTFSSRLNASDSDRNGGDVNLNFLQSLQQLCSQSNGNSPQTLAQLDLVTPSTFDNQYYVNLISGEGLLPSDQALVTGDDQTHEIVQSYADDPAIFFEEFKKSMLKMGSLGQLTEDNGEIRQNCRNVNQT